MNLRVLYVFALETEIPAGRTFPGLHIFTGVGKVNAAMRLTEAIIKHKPHIVINYGSAGSIGPVSGLVKCGTFVQLDMDVSGLGFERYHTPFDPLGGSLHFCDGATCGTSDKFVTDGLAGHTAKVDLVDMEAYALAKVCKTLGVNFVSYKWISDGANGDSITDWEQNQALGYDAFLAKMGL